MAGAIFCETKGTSSVSNSVKLIWFALGTKSLISNSNSPSNCPWVINSKSDNEPLE